MRLIRAFGTVIATGVAAAGAAATAVGTSPASCQGVKQPPKVGSLDTEFQAVAATSACNAWAVGASFNGAAEQTLIEHWNGKAWKRVPSQNPGGSTNDNFLEGVSVDSPSDAWAVGYYSAAADQTLIEHWNGKTWKKVKSLNPGGSANNDSLQGVAALSSNDVWAVGHFNNGTANRTLIEHWNGNAWKVVQSPSAGGSSAGNFLNGVAATSSHDAWAVGLYNDGSANQTLIEHWNGKAWKQVKSQDPGGSGNYNVLDGVAASSNTAWAVGVYFNGTTNQTLVEHWNGKAWKVQKSPNRGIFAQFQGVAATSSTNAWAVGYFVKNSANHTLVEHWTGKAWKVQPSPNLGLSDQLNGVAAISPTDAWAVGSFLHGTAVRNLALRWNGSAWRH
jgi:hypothetical protein